MLIQDKVYTVAEFEALDAVHDSDRRLELINGKVVEKVPTHRHGDIVMALIKAILAYLATNDIGELKPEVSYRLPGDEHNARIPDLSFLSTDRVWKGDKPAPYMPDLAIEVQSPKQSEKLLQGKAAYYVANGSRLVWLIFPDKRTVEVYTPDGTQTLAAGDTLTGGGVLPGLEIDITSIFDAANPPGSAS